MARKVDNIISEADVRKVAMLARLKMTDQEIPTMAEELNSILGYVKQLEEIDVEGVETMSHVHGSSNILRDDKTIPSLTNQEMLKNAPDSSGRFIRVPIIIE